MKPISIYNYEKSTYDRLDTWPADYYLEWKPYIHPRWWKKFCVSVEVLGLHPRTAYIICKNALERSINE